MADRGRVQFVVNPTSGRGSNRSVLAELQDRMRHRGYEVDQHITRGPGEATELARQCCESPAEALVVWGGDGTIRETVDGLTGEGVPILTVPGGTENLLAQYFGFRLDSEWLWRVFERRREVKLDVGLRDGQRFLMVAGIGFDAEVVRDLHERRSGCISYWNYVGPLWRALWNYRHPRLVVELDGVVAYEGPGLVLIGNIPRYGMGLPIHPHARPDDRMLDVCIFPCASKLALIRHAVRVVMREHVESHDVIYRQVREIVVRSEDNAPVEIDGDFAGRLPARFSLAAEQARFLVPDDWKIAERE